MKKIKFVIIVLIFVAVGFFLFTFFVSKDKLTSIDNVLSEDVVQSDISQNSSVPLRTYEGKTSSNGRVEIKIQPRVLSSGELGFDIEFDTHTGSLDQDVMKIVSLIDDRGNTILPVRWDGSPPGGHHRAGTLIFPRTMPQWTSVTVVVRDGGDLYERKFMWQL